MRNMRLTDRGRGGKRELVRLWRLWECMVSGRGSIEDYIFGIWEAGRHGYGTAADNQAVGLLRRPLMGQSRRLMVRVDREKGGAIAVKFMHKNFHLRRMHHSRYG